MDILIHKKTDIEDLFHIFNDLNSNHYQETINIWIDNAKHFSMDRIMRLAMLILYSDLEIEVNSLGDIDFTELVFGSLCSTSGLCIPRGCKITMDSIIPVSKEELTKIATQLSEMLPYKADIIIKSYENKDVIDMDDIYIKNDSFEVE